MNLITANQAPVGSNIRWTVYSHLAKQPYVVEGVVTATREREDCILLKVQTADGALKNVLVEGEINVVHDINGSAKSGCTLELI